MNDYRVVNLANWNSRVPHHEQGYELGLFRSDPTHLSNVVRFDLPRQGRLDGLDVVHPHVYTGIGALCWLPDVRRWAEVVAKLLRPGGRLFIREGHPMLWTLADPSPDGLLVVEYPNFETGGLPFSEPYTYVEHDEPLASPDTISFNHGLAEVITAVLEAGLSLTAIEEHHSVPWNPLGDAMEELADISEYRLQHLPERLPATYTLQAEKASS